MLPGTTDGGQGISRGNGGREATRPTIHSLHPFHPSPPSPVPLFKPPAPPSLLPLPCPSPSPYRCHLKYLVGTNGIGLTTASLIFLLT